MTGEAILAAVQALDTNELAQAMNADPAIVEKLRQLEAYAGGSTVVELLSYMSMNSTAPAPWAPAST